MHRFPFQSIALALLLLPGAAWSQRFTLTPLPLEMPGVSVYGIGDGGHLVGSYRHAEAGYQAFRMDRHGTLAALQFGLVSSMALGVNAAGEVVGQVFGAEGIAAAHWSADGVLSTLPMIVANSINDAGQVSGQVGSYAARWSAQGGLEQLPGPGQTSGSGNRINAAGTVLGNSGVLYEPRATLWRVGQAPLDLGALTGSDASFGGAINAQGWVAGYGRTGFLWDEVNGLRDLPGLVPAGLNAAVQVVGSPEANGPPVLWNQRTGTHDLGALTGHTGIIGVVGINRHAQVGIRTQVEGFRSGGVLTLHPDWAGGHGAWHDGEHWDWAGTGIAPAQLGAMHDARIAVGEDTRVRLDGDASARSLELRADGPASATVELQGRRIELETELRVGAGGVLDGPGTLVVGGEVHFEPGAALVLDAGEALLVGAPLVLDGGVLRMQLGSRLVIDGDLKPIDPRLELRLGVFEPQAGQRFDLLDWTGQLAQIPESWSMLQPLLPAGLAWDTDSLWIDGSVAIQAVPEPANVALLALGLGVVGWRRLARQVVG